MSSEEHTGDVCLDCRKEIEKWDLRIRVDRRGSTNDAVFYHAECYSKRDKIASAIVEGHSNV